MYINKTLSIKIYVAKLLTGCWDWMEVDGMGGGMIKLTMNYRCPDNSSGPKQCYTDIEVYFRSIPPI